MPVNWCLLSADCMLSFVFRLFSASTCHLLSGAHCLQYAVCYLPPFMILSAIACRLFSAHLLSYDCCLSSAAFCMCLLPFAYWLLPVVCGLLSANCCLLAAAYYPLNASCYLLTMICQLLCIVSYLRPVICYIQYCLKIGARYLLQTSADVWLLQSVLLCFS
jgi:hypothetical protein